AWPRMRQLLLPPKMMMIFRVLLVVWCWWGLSVEGSAWGVTRVVAWNIEWFPGQQMNEVTPEMEERHMTVVQSVLREMNPCVLLSSEIRDWRSFDLAVSVVPGLKVCAVSAFRDREFGELWRQQVAIAARLPVVAAWSESFRPTLTSMVRGFAFAALEAPQQPGKVWLFYSVHLKSNRAFNQNQAEINYRLRNESIRQILSHVEEMERLVFRDRVAAVIVAGDFNTNHDGQFGDEVVKMMTAAGFRNTWEGVPRGERLTWRGSEQFEPTTFDYVFTRGLPRLRARMLEVPAEASDHHAVLLEIP
ncbi:MAG: endonuclease/exonuclease/phosphatase family protein, partial [Verrucomicrobiia bacterium]